MLLCSQQISFGLHNPQDIIHCGVFSVYERALFKVCCNIVGAGRGLEGGCMHMLGVPAAACSIGCGVVLCVVLHVGTEHALAIAVGTAGLQTSRCYY